MKNIKYHVYKVTETFSGKFYFGMTKNPKLRKCNHLSLVQKNTVCNFDKNNSVFEILETFDNKIKAIECENDYISKNINNSLCLNSGDSHSIAAKSGNNAKYALKWIKENKKEHSIKTSLGLKNYYKKTTKEEKLKIKEKCYKANEKNRKAVLMYDLLGNFIKEFESGRSIIKEFPDLNKDCIYRVANGKSKQHKGYIFKYK